MQVLGEFRGFMGGQGQEALMPTDHATVARCDY